MLVTDIQTAARDSYNATGDSFFPDSQLNLWITQGCNEMCTTSWLIDSATTTSTVSGTQAYAYPTNAIAIKRVTVGGKKIKRITQRQDDSITLSNQASTQSGYPVYYYDFDGSIYLRPIPDAIYTLVIQTNNMQTPITSNVVPLDIPAVFHFYLVDYCLMRMFQKDKDIPNVQLHLSIWNDHLKKVSSYKQLMKRQDSFTTVQDEETLPVTILGEV